MRGWAVAAVLLSLLPLAVAQGGGGGTSSGTASTTTEPSSGPGGGGGGSTSTSSGCYCTSTSYGGGVSTLATAWLISAGTGGVASVPQGTSRDIPVTVAARGRSLVNAHLVVDEPGGVLVEVDPLVRTVQAGSERVFWLRLQVPAGAAQQGYSVQLHAQGTNGQTPVETLQVVAYTPGTGGTTLSLPAVAPTLVMLGLLGVALVRRRLP